MSLAEKITEVPELYEKKDESTACLLRDAGFLDTSQALKVQDVEDALRRHPALADQWLERGRDQRLTGGWGIECDHGQYRVQSFSNGRYLLDGKKLHAVAEFVVRYVGFIRDVMNRYPGQARLQLHEQRVLSAASRRPLVNAPLSNCAQTRPPGAA